MEIVIDPILAANETFDEYYDESSESGQTTTDSPWLDELIEETGNRYALIYQCSAI